MLRWFGPGQSGAALPHPVIVPLSGERMRLWPDEMGGRSG
ncbi:hypothetical protein HMPREF3196_01444 [Bifidobacterium bifidum]|uniref:Uncharacterized protein n=1 Tax=Bifidobacterium bifidum TaxID=1681 RepID=A0A133KN66_BIFBI|nr:hypothetical protein HMPREF3196_01444 [Bifidobacterium bifidum]